jgi:hypothetical protein
MGISGEFASHFLFLVKEQAFNSARYNLGYNAQYNPR